MDEEKLIDLRKVVTITFSEEQCSLLKTYLERHKNDIYYSLFRGDSEKQNDLYSLINELIDRL